MMNSIHSKQIIETSKIVGKARVICDLEFQNTEFWLNQTINQTPKQSKIVKKECEICSTKGKCELHHIAGEKFDFRTISACVPCHRWLTNRQKLYDARWWFPTNDENIKQGFFYLGIYDILILKAKKTGNAIYESIANSYIETISQYLRRAAQ